MRRNVDTARGPQQRISAQQGEIEDLARAHGRGTTAMRDAAGNILEMNPAAPYPLLTPQSIDSAVAFKPSGAVAFTSTDTLENRPIEAAEGAFTGTVSTPKVETPTVQATTVNSPTVNATTLGGQIRDYQGDWAMGAATANQMRCGEAEAPVGGRYTGREITLEGNAFFKGNCFVNGNFIDNTPSERRLKNHENDIDGLSVINALKTGVFTWKNQEERDARRHVGIYVDELAEVAPDAIVQPVDPSDIPTENPEDILAYREGGRGYEDRALIAYLVDAVQNLSGQVERLQAQLQEKEGSG